MNPLNKEIRDRIELFAEELAELVRQSALESVHAALGESAGAPRTTRTKKTGGKRSSTVRRKKTAAKRRKGGRQVRRTSEELETLSSAIASYVRSNPGERLEQIAKALGLSTAEMKRPVTLLLQSKKLSTKGQKRGTMYFARGAAGRKVTKKKATRKKKARRKAARRL